MARRWLTTLVGVVLLVGCSNDGGVDATVATDGSETTGTEPSTDSSTTSTSRSTTSSSEASSSPFADPYLGPLVFAWPQDCSVPVTETIGKNGERVGLSYNISITSLDEGMLVQFVDLTVLTLNDQPISDGLQEQARAAFVLPGFVVDAEGFAVEMTGFDETIDALEDLGMASPVMRTPEFRAVTEEAVINKYWESLAGFWAGVGSIDEPSTQTTVSVPLNGDSFEIDLLIESFGATIDGDAILRMTQRIEGDEFLRSIGAVQTALGGTSDASLDDALAGGHRISTVDLTTDPQTLQPLRVELSIDNELTIGGRTETELERRNWVFDWDAGDCNP